MWAKKNARRDAVPFTVHSFRHSLGDLATETGFPIQYSGPLLLLRIFLPWLTPIFVLCSYHIRIFVHFDPYCFVWKTCLLHGFVASAHVGFSACTVAYSDHGNGQQQQFFYLVSQLVERRVKNRQHRRRWRSMWMWRLSFERNSAQKDKVNEDDGDAKQSN